MFVSDSLIFTELHKTGGSHILRCLDAVLDGQRVGKHNRIPPELRDRFVIGSIRNPWDWYVSLWSYGCSQRGGVFERTRHRFGFQYYWRQLNKEMGRNWLTPRQYLTQLVFDSRKPMDEWQEVYSDSNNPELFRKWLTLVLSPERRFDLGEGFGFSPVCHHSGLLTYRYLKLFTHLDQRLYNDAALRNKDELSNIYQDTGFVNRFIRNERLEQDLLEALNSAGIPMTDSQKDLIASSKDNKTNTSERRATEFYYDHTTVNLVQDKESLIITNHGYEAPNI